MGLFDSMLGSLGGGQGGLVEMVGGMIAKQPGGLAGLVRAFEAQGLGATIASWIGTGANLPISAEQIKAVLGDERLQEIAGKIGLPAGLITSQLATLMPQAVDQMTPEGKLPG